MRQPNEVDLAAVDKWSMKDISPPDDTVVEAEVGNMYHSPYPSLMRSSEITKDNLRVGDVIVRAEGEERRVLEVLEHVFLVNSGPLYQNTGTLWITFKSKALSEWSIKLPASEQPKQQLTDAQRTLCVACPTQEDYDQLMKVCEELTFKWQNI